MKLSKATDTFLYWIAVICLAIAIAGVFYGAWILTKDDPLARVTVFAILIGAGSFFLRHLTD